MAIDQDLVQRMTGIKDLVLSVQVKRLRKTLANPKMLLERRKKGDSNTMPEV